MKSKEKYLTTKDLSQRWAMSEGTLRNWRCQGRGPQFIRLGKSPTKKDLVRYRLSDILRFEKEQIENPVPK